MDKATRILNILTLLLNGHVVTQEDLDRFTNVSKKSIQRDINTINTFNTILLPTRPLLLLQLLLLLLLRWLVPVLTWTQNATNWAPTWHPRGGAYSTTGQR